MKRKRRLPARIKEKLFVPGVINDTWSIDFMSDSLANGRRFQVINIIDDYNRESLLNEAYYSIPATRLVQKVKEVLLHRGKPKCIRTDNGPEFIAKEFKDFCSVFESINQVNALAYEWQIDYNCKHPHKALNGLSPWLYAKEALVS